jgi:hypothetical protein
MIRSSGGIQLNVLDDTIFNNMLVHYSDVLLADE